VLVQVAWSGAQFQNEVPSMARLAELAHFMNVEIRGTLAADWVLRRLGGNFVEEAEAELR
jgi:hypothetical protein